MMHSKRHWNVEAHVDNEEFAEKLRSTTWTLCTAFKTSAGTVWANDSTSPDALQEYAILRQGEEGGDWKQVESITVSWCSQGELERLMSAADRGEFDVDDWGSIPGNQLEDDHDRCPHCM